MTTTVITPERAGSLAGLFRERVDASPEKVAYRQFDPARGTWARCTWADMAHEVGRWQMALRREGLEPGDRVAMMLRNCREWITFDQAALGLGLVTVPLYTDDRPDNVAYILEQAGVKVLLLEDRAQWRRLHPVRDRLPTVTTIVSLRGFDDDSAPGDPRLTAAADWLFGLDGDLITRLEEPDHLATIVYTSGTTGRPKGVMLSHRALLFNAHAASQCAPLGGEDVFLSFLPLSHTLERTAGYFLPMAVGAEVAFARSIAQLAEDLRVVQPTVLVSVPRIYESVYAKIQAGLKQKPAFARRLFQATVNTGWARFEYLQRRAGWSPRLLLWPLLRRLVARQVLERLGGRLEYAVCGGAPLPPPIARFFIGLGLPVYHGYGLTEASPVVTVNRPDDNLPASIGKPLPGVEIRIGEQDELLTRSPSVMLGYWRNDEATAAAIDSDGWLHTGDKARVDDRGFVFITGRIKDIIVLGNGEKVPPADMEMAIQLDPLFDQVLVIGEARPFLSALVVLDDSAWREFAAELDIDPDSDDDLRGRFAERSLLARVQAQLKDFPGYARIRRLTALREPWTIDDGLLTPTLKMKRARILDRHRDHVDRMYADYTDA
ncbi:AMP-dependent synthetase/ligase [Thioalkalivibrio paradoxus]|uniref:AMP-dependent synthetase n=1 Tax=Thioalkalivibrio paradoxus ARh 1 TaxID=713585 RepID=W0DK56_9GAMM|nr:long-chain fatty acid--CoA ligase [Thioalkalivibrio paradoxus]AHE98831.1 AMP-dependent synthetase [Thioalkalivibrio paradoxus ARh 1]